MTKLHLAVIGALLTAISTSLVLAQPGTDPRKKAVQEKLKTELEQFAKEVGRVELLLAYTDDALRLEVAQGRLSSSEAEERLKARGNEVYNNGVRDEDIRAITDLHRQVVPAYFRRIHQAAVTAQEWPDDLPADAYRKNALEVLESIQQGYDARMSAGLQTGPLLEQATEVLAWTMGKKTAPAAINPFRGQRQRVIAAIPDPRIRAAIVATDQQLAKFVPTTSAATSHSEVGKGPSMPAATPGLSKAKYETNSIGMRLTLIPPGEFLMGTQGNENNPDADDPAHRVRITRPFYLGVHEVTVGNFREFVRDTGHQAVIGVGYNPQTESIAVGDPRFNFSWEDAGWPQSENHPVINVSQVDAMAFCRWLSEKEGKKYRLPTEAEWEYACRAGTTTVYSSGDDETSLREVANVPDSSFKQKFAFARAPGNDYTKTWDDTFPFTAPIGSFKPNAFGLYDMHGNVQEWCSDWYGKDYYRQSPQDDPQGPTTGENPVRRGGDWCEGAICCRSAFRRIGLPAHWVTYYVGFRIVREADATSLSNPIGITSAAGPPATARNAAAAKVTVPNGDFGTGLASAGRPAETSPKNATEIRRFNGHSKMVLSVAMSRDGRRALSACFDGVILLWDVNTGETIRRFPEYPITGSVGSVAFSSDGRRALFSGHINQVWDLTTGQKISSFELEDKPMIVASAAFSPDGQRVLTGDSNALRLWDVESGRQKLLMECTYGDLPEGAKISSPVLCVAIAPNGRFVLVGCQYGPVRLWDLKAGKELRHFDVYPHSLNPVECVAISPDGRRALFTGHDKTIRLWDLETAREVRRFEGHTGWVECVAFSPDGRRAISGAGSREARLRGEPTNPADCSLVLWDVETGKELRRFDAHTDSVRSVAFSPDGQRVLSGSLDKTVRLWELPD